MKVANKRNRNTQFVLVIFVLFAVVVLAAFLIVRKVSSQYKAIKLDGVTYTFKVADDQVTTPSPGYIRINTPNGAAVIISAKKSGTKLTCVENGSTKSFDVTNGQTNYPVCSNQSHSGYVASFKYGDTWHQVILVSEDQKTPIAVDRAKRIYESLKIQ